MSLLDPIVDPIESSINSLLDPLTSGLSPTSTADVLEATQSTTTQAPNSPSTQAQQTATSTIAIVPVSTQQPQSSAEVPSTVISQAEPTVAQTSSPSTPRTTATSPTATASRTTFSTSTRASVSALTPSSLKASSTTSALTTSSSSRSISTSSSTTPAAPSATSPAPSNARPRGEGGGISKAGIAVAIIFAILLLGTAIFLIFKFFPPLRRRLDAYYQKRREDRSYREAIDGPDTGIGAVVGTKDGEKDKDDFYSLSSSKASSMDRAVDKSLPSVPAVAAKERGTGTGMFSLPASAVAGVTHGRPRQIQVATQPAQSKRLSFSALGKNSSVQQAPRPQIPTSQTRDKRYSWEVQGGESGPVVHKQYISPTSAGAEGPRGNGLGLGKVSLLRDHSLLRKAGYDVPPRPTGPSIDQTQAEIANANPTTTKRASRLWPAATPRKSIEKAPRKSSEEVKRKPVPVVAKTRMALAAASKPGPPQVQKRKSRLSWVKGDDRVGQIQQQLVDDPTPIIERPNPLGKLRVVNKSPSPPPSPVARISQIGLAVSATPPPPENRGSVGVAK